MKSYPFVSIADLERRALCATRTLQARHANKLSLPINRSEEFRHNRRLIPVETFRTLRYKVADNYAMALRHNIPSPRRRKRAGQESSDEKTCFLFLLFLLRDKSATELYRIAYLLDGEELLESSWVCHSQFCCRTEARNATAMMMHFAEVVTTAICP